MENTGKGPTIIIIIVVVVVIIIIIIIIIIIYIHTLMYIYIYEYMYIYIYICLFHAVSSIFDFITSVIKAVKVNWKDLEEKSRGLVKIQIRHLSGCVFR